MIFVATAGNRSWDGYCPNPVGLYLCAMNPPDAFVTVSPATGETLARYPLFSGNQLESALHLAYQRFLAQKSAPTWPIQPQLKRMAELLQARKQTYAALITSEMGKPLYESIAEIEKCATACIWYAEEQFTFEEPAPIAGASLAWRPLGVILGIMPWNFPFWQAIRFAVPTLLAGNTVLLKHAPATTGCSLALAQLFLEAGFETGDFQSIVVETDSVATLLADRRVAGVSLTGSTRAGRAVAALAGQHLKPVLLELGGSDPYLVLADADLDKVVNAVLEGRLRNAGQSCIAAKRIIAVPEVHDELLARLKTAIEPLSFGDPLDPANRLGPLARHDLRQTLHQQVESTVAQGATLVLGGYLPDGPGFFYPPTLLAQVQPGQPAWHEELFGPVVALIAARDTDDAIRIANDTDFGLGAAIFTENMAFGREVATYVLEAGTCVVNDFVRSDPRLPFGGVRDSGTGRELGTLGLRSFANAKIVRN